MSAIIRYIIHMLPFMAVALPVYAIGRILFIKAKRFRPNWLREITMLIFSVFLAGLASQTVIPQISLDAGGFHFVTGGTHRTNLVPFRVVLETYREVAKGNIQYFIINFLGNVILFIPLGLVIPLLWKTSTCKTVLMGFCSSFFIEFCQLFLARGTDVDDLILNTSGVLLGALFYLLLQKYCNCFTEKFR